MISNKAVWEKKAYYHLKQKKSVQPTHIVINNVKIWLYTLLLWYIPYWINGQFVPTKVKNSSFWRRPLSFWFKATQRTILIKTSTVDFSDTGVPIAIRCLHATGRYGIKNILDFRDMPFPSFENILTVCFGKVLTSCNSGLSNMQWMHSYRIRCYVLTVSRMLVQTLGQKKQAYAPTAKEYMAYDGGVSLSQLWCSFIFQRTTILY